MSERMFSNVLSALGRAANARSTIAGSDLVTDSPAALDIELAEAATGSDLASRRLTFAADLWSSVATDQLGAIATLLEDRSTVFGLTPLLRAVIEHAAAVIWLLDPSLSPGQRWVRAGLYEFDAVFRDGETVSLWTPRGADARAQTKARRLALVEDLRALSASLPVADDAAPDKFDSRPFALGGEMLPSVEAQVAFAFGDERAKLWRGVYGYLCGRGPHPSFAASEYWGPTPADGFTLKAETIEKLCRPTLGAHGRALQHLMSWLGHPPGEMDAFTDSINAQIPGTFVDDDSAAA